MTCGDCLLDRNSSMSGRAVADLFNSDMSRHEFSYNLPEHMRNKVESRVSSPGAQLVTQFGSR